MNATITDAIKAAGFRPFVRPGSDSYAYYTDGKNIGYAQADKVCTVHIPNQQTGTGFIVSEGPITREALLAGFATAPDWAQSSAREYVKKYSSLDSFLKNNNWGGGLVEV